MEEKKDNLGALPETPCFPHLCSVLIADMEPVGMEPSLCTKPNLTLFPGCEKCTLYGSTQIFTICILLY